MNTLRAKIAVLLVVAIVSVVSLLTVVLFYLLGPPKRVHSLSPVAQQIEMLVAIVEEGKTDRPQAGASAIAGPRLCGFTQRLRASLAARGITLPVTVSRDGSGAPLVVSIPIDDKGWLLLPITDLPPQGVPWGVLFRWLALITLGATAIAVFVANRMVSPLVLLEDAVESVGADAMLLPGLPRARPGRGEGHGAGAELAVGAAEERGGEPHAPGRGGGARSPHADHAHAAQGRVRRGPGGPRAVAVRSR